jgi:hypothetical protein
MCAVQYLTASETQLNNGVSHIYANRDRSVDFYKPFVLAVHD